jgi:hypothetical protein
LINPSSQAFELGLDLLADRRFGGGESLRGTVEGKVQPPQLFEARAEDGLTLHPEIGGGGVEVVNSALGRLHHHLHTGILLIDILEAHPPESEDRALFPSGTVWLVYHCFSSLFCP